MISKAVISFYWAMCRSGRLFLLIFMLQIKPASRVLFFQEIQTELDSLNIEADCDMIIGGDFNVVLDPEFDGLGGKPKLKESVKIIEQIRLSFDLIDIWRVRNPDERHFS